MKRLTRRGFTAAGILAALSLSPLGNIGLKGCSPDYDPSGNEVEAVYGPPEDYEPDPVDVDDFDPDDNELIDVYGPPADAFDEDDFEAEENIAPALYGPPPND